MRFFSGRGFYLVSKFTVEISRSTCSSSVAPALGLSEEAVYWQLVDWDLPWGHRDLQWYANGPTQLAHPLLTRKFTSSDRLACLAWGGIVCCRSTDNQITHHSNLFWLNTSLNKRGDWVVEVVGVPYPQSKYYFPLPTGFWGVTSSRGFGGFSSWLSCGTALRRPNRCNTLQVLKPLECSVRTPQAISPRAAQRRYWKTNGMNKWSQSDTGAPTALLPKAGINLVQYSRS